MSVDITGLGAIADLATTVIGKIWPDKSKEEQAQLAMAFQVIQGQMDVNKAEASNPSVFVSGWRPFIGWVCGSACAWNWIGIPIATVLLVAVNHPVALAQADISQMMPILLGMLGLGGLRTIEKIQGVAAK